MVRSLPYFQVIKEILPWFLVLSGFKSYIKIFNPFGIYSYKGEGMDPAFPLDAHPVVPASHAE